MLSRKDEENHFSKSLTVVAEGVLIEGKIYSRGATRVDGKVTGEVISENEFTIGKEGKVEASVKTTNAIIAGHFKGEMVASGEVEITSTGRFIGNLIQKDALLTISKGGLFKGESIISENQEIFKITVPDKTQGPELHLRPGQPTPRPVQPVPQFSGSNPGTGNQ
jgi:cytoskeletal protein CcmA (bactofilin family)